MFFIFKILYKTDVGHAGRFLLFDILEMHF